MSAVNLAQGCGEVKGDGPKSSRKCRAMKKGR